MSLHTGSYNAYQAATRATGTPKDIEYGLFRQVTGDLSRALRDGSPFSDLAAALHANLRLWTAITIDLAGEGNALPPALRAQLIGLAQFTRNHTHQVLKGEGEAGVLVEINTALMRGLRGDGAGEPSDGRSGAAEAAGAA